MINPALFFRWIMEKIENAEMILIGIGEEFESVPDSVSVYNKLASEVSGKNYFIVSMCMDDAIYDSKLDESRIVCPLGGYRKKQCPDACTDDLYDVNESLCPHCGKELVYNNILAENYVEAGYLPMWQKQKLWLTGTLNKRLLVLELGVSLRLPQIVRLPFERITALNEKSELVRVNQTFPQINAEISSRATAVKQSAVEWVKSL